MTTRLAGLEADAYELAMDPDPSADVVLRAVHRALATPPSTPTDAEMAANRAVARGVIRAWRERTEGGGVEAAEQEGAAWVASLPSPLSVRLANPGGPV